MSPVIHVVHAVLVVLVAVATPIEDQHSSFASTVTSGIQLAPHFALALAMVLALVVVLTLAAVLALATTVEGTLSLGKLA